MSSCSSRGQNAIPGPGLIKGHISPAHISPAHPTQLFLEHKPLQTMHPRWSQVVPCSNPTSTRFLQLLLKTIETRLSSFIQVLQQHPCCCQGWVPPKCSVIQLIQLTRPCCWASASGSVFQIQARPTCSPVPGLRSRDNTCGDGMAVQ